MQTIKKNLAWLQPKSVLEGVAGRFGKKMMLLLGYLLSWPCRHL